MRVALESGARIRWRAAMGLRFLSMLFVFLNIKFGLLNCILPILKLKLQDRGGSWAFTRTTVSLFWRRTRTSDLEPTALTTVFPGGEAWTRLLSLVRTPLDLGEIDVLEVGPRPSCLELLRRCQVWAPLPPPPAAPSEKLLYLHRDNWPSYSPCLGGLLYVCLSWRNSAFWSGAFSVSQPNPLSSQT